MLINRKRVKISRRDSFLVLFGVAYLLVGYSYLSIPPLYKPLLHAQFRLALDFAPIEFYGWLWIAAGALCIAGGAVHRYDSFGFAAGVAMPLIWSCACWAAALDGVPRAWVSGVLYAVFGLAVWIVSGMYDPRRYGPRSKGGA